MPNIDDLRVTDKNVDDIIKCVEDTLNGKPLTKSNILRVVVECMSVTSKMSTLPNQTKKKVLVTGLERYLDKTEMEAETKEGLLLMLSEVVDSAIDLFSDIKKGTVKLNKCCVLL